MEQKEIWLLDIYKLMGQHQSWDSKEFVYDLVIKFSLRLLMKKCVKI